MLFDFAYIERDVSKIDAETAEGIHLLTIGSVYTEIEDTKRILLAIPEKKDYISFEKAITDESKRRLLEALPVRIEGIEYGRKELVSLIKEFS